jgi:hypothetical protein
MIDVAIIHRGFGDSLTSESSYTNLCAVGGVKGTDISKSLGKTVGTCDISLNGLDAYSEFFGSNDSIDVYASYSKLDTSSLVDMYANNSSSFLMSSNVGLNGVSIGENGNAIDLTCSDKTIVLTNINAERSYWIASQNYAICRVGGDDTNSVIHQIIAEVNEKMRTAYNESNPLGGNKWQNLTISDSDIDSTVAYDAGQLVAAFPFKTYAEILNDLAGGTYTGNVQFTYWIDATNAFHWKKLDNLKTNDLIYGTNNVRSFNFKRDVYDTVTAAIVNAGVDLNGIGIYTYVVDDAYATELGLRWTIFADTLFAKQFESITSDNGTASSVSGAILTDSTKSWTTNQWQNKYLLNPTRARSFKIASNTATTITVNGEGLQKGAYYIYDGDNDSFRTQMKAKSSASSQSMLTKTAKLRYRGDIVLNGINTYNLNSVTDILQPYLGFTALAPKRMRLSDLAHNISNGNWSTTLTFKEDVGTEGIQ